MLNTINGLALDANERAVAAVADRKARTAYKRKHGGAAVSVPEGYRVRSNGEATSWTWRDDAARDEVATATAAASAAWEASHRTAYDAAAYRASVAAVKKVNARYGNLDRIAALGLAGRAARKPAAVVKTVAAPVVVETPAPVVLAVVPDVAPVVPILAPAATTAPDNVPAPMPAMTRAARKASRRELASAMRAAGIAPSGIAWELATAGVPLEDIAGRIATVTAGV